MGVDFTLLTPHVTLGGGQGSTQCVVVDIISDQTTEGIEDFQLQLYLNESSLREMGLVALTPDTAIISIIDDDRKIDCLNVILCGGKLSRGSVSVDRHKIFHI